MQVYYILDLELCIILFMQLFLRKVMDKFRGKKEEKEEIVFKNNVFKFFLGDLIIKGIM